jgi:hypothetical protein
MRRFVIATFCLLVLFSSQCIFSYADKPVTNFTLSFTAPLKAQQVTAGKPLLCKGTFKKTAAITDLSKVNVWLFLMDVRQGCYYIQRPVSLNKNGTWDGTLAFRKDTVRLLAFLTDASTDKLFKSWLAKGLTGKQYELPRGAQLLASVDVKPY